MPAWLYQVGWFGSVQYGLVWLEGHSYSVFYHAIEPNHADVLVWTDS